MKYRKKPVVIEAMEIPGPGGPWLPFLDWATAHGIVGMIRFADNDTDIGVLVDTLEGTMHGRAGDFLIIGVQGEVYPCKPDIFEATYEAVGADG